MCRVLRTRSPSRRGVRRFGEHEANRPRMPANGPGNGIPNRKAFAHLLDPESGEMLGLPWDLDGLRARRPVAQLEPISRRDTGYRVTSAASLASTHNSLYEGDFRRRGIGTSKVETIEPGPYRRPRRRKISFDLDGARRTGPGVTGYRIIRENLPGQSYLSVICVAVQDLSVGGSRHN